MNTATRNVSLLAGLVVAAATSTASADVTDKVEGDSAVSPRPHHLRMVAEAAAIQGIGTAWYWRNTGSGWGESNRVDWQLGFKGSALVSKLEGTGWRMDGNPYLINSFCHPMSGSLSYYVARSNGYSELQAFGISSLMSVSWEVFTEWAEYGAPNDLLATSPAGVSIGESVYQIRHHWSQARKELQLGAGANDGDAVGSIAGRIALDTLPSEGEGTVVGGKKIGVGVEMPFDGAGVRSIEAGTKTSLVGHYDNTRDHRLFAGASTEFHFVDQMKRDSREWDYMTTVSAGPTLDTQVRFADATIDAGTDVYAEFGILKAQAFDKWRGDHPMEIVRNTMSDRVDPYYYGAGVAVTPRLNVAYKGVNAGGKVAAHMFKSINGLDRDQEILTADPSIRDIDRSAEAWLAYSHRNVTMAVDGRSHHRTGKIEEARSAHDDTTTMFTVAYRR